VTQWVSFFTFRLTHTHTHHVKFIATLIHSLQALVEILLLSGGTPYANFKDLAHAWGREKGFHHILANAICERRGAVERKRRSDAGKRLTPEERELFRQKLKKARTKEDGTEDSHMPADIPEDDSEDEIAEQHVRKRVKELKTVGTSETAHN
jgi:hypothetical protein